jgi:hypothetical protein
LNAVSRQLGVLIYLQFTFDELLEAVQASEDELTQGLHHLNACVIDGSVFFLVFFLVIGVITR